MSAQRPIIYAGRGVDVSNARKDFNEFIERVGAPVVVSWNGADLIYEDHPLYVGRPGIFGQRAANFAVQNSDVLLNIGSRLSIGQLGYNFNSFARSAYKIIVDVDKAELDKKTIKPDLKIESDAKLFLEEMNRQLGGRKGTYGEWMEICNKWKADYPVINPENFKGTYINSYALVDRLSTHLTGEDIVVTDMGTSFTGTFQSMRLKKGQRLFTSSGVASMGFGLPGAIGACVANGRKRTICVSGDGGLQFNIQELQTVKHNNLPIKLFVFNNGGYNSITSMQEKNFGEKYVGSEKSSGVSTPDFVKVAEAYGIRAIRIDKPSELDEKVREAIFSEDPILCDVKLDLSQKLEPRVMSQLTAEGWKPSPLEDMSPLLSDEEFRRNMIIKPLR